MATSTAKRVTVYRWERQPADVIVNPGAYLLAAGIECLSSSGSLQVIPFGDIKALCFVVDFGGAGLFENHRYFERRPRLPGLWTRLTFLDGDQLDGILSHNLLEWPPQGYMIVPPHSSASRQRVFIPREALKSTELRGVVGVSVNPVMAKRYPVSGEKQLEMFE